MVLATLSQEKPTFPGVTTLNVLRLWSHTQQLECMELEGKKLYLSQLQIVLLLLKKNFLYNFQIHNTNI